MFTTHKKYYRSSKIIRCSLCNQRLRIFLYNLCVFFISLSLLQFSPSVAYCNRNCLLLMLHSFRDYDRAKLLQATCEREWLFFCNRKRWLLQILRHIKSKQDTKNSEWCVNNKKNFVVLQRQTFTTETNRREMKKLIKNFLESKIKMET